MSFNVVFFGSSRSIFAAFVFVTCLQPVNANQSVFWLVVAGYPLSIKEEEKCSFHFTFSFQNFLSRFQDLKFSSSLNLEDISSSSFQRCMTTIKLLQSPWSRWWPDEARPGLLKVKIIVSPLFLNRRYGNLKELLDEMVDAFSNNSYLDFFNHSCKIYGENLRKIK